MTDGRPQDITSNLSHPRAWIEMNSSALSTTLMWPCPEQRGVTMGCLYLDIEGQSCLVGSVDQGSMKNRQIDLFDRMTKKRARKTFSSYFPRSDVTRNLSANNPHYRLSIVIGIRSHDFACWVNHFLRLVDPIFNEKISSEARPSLFALLISSV